MQPANENYFLQTIYTLRTNGELLLFTKKIQSTTEEQKEVLEFLQLEYENECIGWPGNPPPFDGAAAVWAAQLVYASAHLLLYRENKVEDLPGLLPPFPDEMTPGAVLSADLCLRFLPDLCRVATRIDYEDALIALLTEHLARWHYSGIGFVKTTTEPDFSIIHQHACLAQLYTDRVIMRKERSLAAYPPLEPLIKAVLGNHQKYFWKELL